VLSRFSPRGGIFGGISAYVLFFGFDDDDDDGERNETRSLVKLVGVEEARERVVG